MLVLAVNWMAHAGHENEVAATFSKLQAASRHEPGCLMYIVHRHTGDPRRFFEKNGVDIRVNSPRANQLYLPLNRLARIFVFLRPVAGNEQRRLGRFRRARKREGF